MEVDFLTKEAVLKIGEVSEIDGLRVFVKVDKNKNLSELFYDGEVLANVSVNSYVEIKKGFLSIIGKVDGEKLEEDTSRHFSESGYERTNKNKRYLRINLIGYIDEEGCFKGGTKELPLIGNEAYIVTKNKIKLIHNLVGKSPISIQVATTEIDDLDISFPVDGLFNSHIAIFGNTGSGKSNTLACLYQELCKALHDRNSYSFSQNSRFMLFDFNGEYTSSTCITENKKVYDLSTAHNNGDKIPIRTEEFLSVEILTTLADATEKTQKPFLRRALNFYHHVMNSENSTDYIKNILRKNVRDILLMSDKVKADQLLDHLKVILPDIDNNGDEFDIRDDIRWHTNTFRSVSQGAYFDSNPDSVEQTPLYNHVENYSLATDLLSGIIHFLYLQLIKDVISSRAQNEHIAPAINKLKSKQTDIEKVFTLSEESTFWERNFVVISLHNVNLDMRKTIPLLIAKKEYSDHKNYNNQKSLNIIIDEAHNILSRQSFREAETWKDYRLETFEEIIKEGRKFGVFVTISSQRPNDISQTIISQAHNYFIHRLINQKDLDTISNAVSYIDKYTELSIPTLPTGTCIFSGVASQTPLKVNIKPLPDELRPNSGTLKFQNIVEDITDIFS